MTDTINPNYYKDTEIEPIDVIEDWNLGFNLGSTIKYIKRAGKKDGNSRLQDLLKIKWYVEREIKNEEKNEAFEDVKDYFKHDVNKTDYITTVNQDDIEKFWEEF